VGRALGLGCVGRGTRLGGGSDSGGAARFGSAGNAGVACTRGLGAGLGAEVLPTGAGGVGGGATEVVLSARVGGGVAARALGRGMTNVGLRGLAPPSTGAPRVRSLDLWVSGQGGSIIPIGVIASRIL
jgi:hypothetical protein